MEDEKEESYERSICPEYSALPQESTTKSIVDDDELDDLLDSALEDFGKTTISKECSAARSQDVTPSSLPLPSTEHVLPPVESSKPVLSPAESSKPVLPSAASAEPMLPTAELSSQQEALFNELFQAAGSEEGGADFEAMMKQMLSGQPDDILKQFEKMSQTVDDMLPSPENASGRPFEDTLQQTLGSLAQNAEELQNSVPEADIMRMLSGMGLDDSEPGEGGDLDFLPMMQGMMKSLMSKEVLYPSLKEVTQKYPKWLEDNATTVSSSDLDKYRKQYQLMSEIVLEFEEERPEDNDSIKKQRFEKIMETMQRMQELGQPPKDLVGDMPAGIDLDENGFPKFPATPGQCLIM